MNEAKPQPSIFRRIIDPACLNYLIMGGAGLGVYFLVMAGKGNTIGAILVIVLAIPGVLARWVISPILALMITSYMLYDPGLLGAINFLGTGRWMVFEEGPGFDLTNVLLAASLLAYLIGHYRLNSLLHVGMPDDPTPRRPSPTTQRPKRPFATVSLDELPRTLAVAGGCLIGGQLVWYGLVMVERLSRPNAYGAGTSRLLLAIWGIGLTTLIIGAALGYLRYSRMSPTEADMVLRDTAYHEMRRETDRLQRWRKWYKDRMALKRRK